MLLRYSGRTTYYCLFQEFLSHCHIFVISNAIFLIFCDFVLQCIITIDTVINDLIFLFILCHKYEQDWCCFSTFVLLFPSTFLKNRVSGICNHFVYLWGNLKTASVLFLSQPRSHLTSNLSQLCLRLHYVIMVEFPLYFFDCAAIHLSSRNPLDKMYILGLCRSDTQYWYNAGHIHWIKCWKKTLYYYVNT